MEIVTIITLLTAYVILLAVKKDTKDLLASQPKLRRKNNPTTNAD